MYISLKEKKTVNKDFSHTKKYNGIIFIRKFSVCALAQSLMLYINRSVFFLFPDVGSFATMYFEWICPIISK